MTLVDFGGIHGTVVRYCTCQEFCWKDSKTKQLTTAGFIPATWTNPKTAFSVQVIKHFHNHSESVYDFTEGLQKDTDGVFPSEVPVSVAIVVYHEYLLINLQDLQSQFAVAERIYGLIVARRHSGQALGISKFLPRRPEGDLCVWCPVCPEPGVNLENGYRTSLKNDPLPYKQLPADAQ
jgi:hypothetical protein